MFFKKRPALHTPMDHFLHRDALSKDERAVLDVYLTGVGHALTGLNTVRNVNNQGPVLALAQDQSLETKDIEPIVADFLKQRPDMQSQTLERDRLNFGHFVNKIKS